MFLQQRAGDFTLSLDKTVFFANSSALLFKTCCNARATLEKMSMFPFLCLIVVLIYHA